MENVLVVGQTPPPVNGQAVMIQGLLDGKYQSMQIHFVRMGFSRAIDEVGIFQLRKLLMLPGILTRIIATRLMSRADILYYPPSGPKTLPVIRDIVFLIATRWMFRYTVFHFHAAGLPEIYPLLPALLRPLYNLAYRDADLAIFTTQGTASAGPKLGAKTVAVVPYGVLDPAKGRALHKRRSRREVPCILFMGILCEGKGLLTLIEACSLLKSANVAFRAVCAGMHDSKEFRLEMEGTIERRGLKDVFQFPGVLQGEDKWKAFEDADIFCFPSHYFAESFGVVLIEAMSFQLPIVTTNWRGIPDVVGGSGGAFVVEPGKPALVAEKLELLLRDSELRDAMGKKNRTWFNDRYTIEKYRQKMEEVLVGVKAS